MSTNMSTKQTESKHYGIEIGDWVILRYSPDSIWMVYLDFAKPYKVQGIELKSDNNYLVEKKLYLIQGLWYDEDEVKKVTPEDDPEYFI